MARSRPAIAAWRFPRALARWPEALLVLVLAVVETALAEPPVGWRMDGTGSFPRAEPALEWSPTQNVLWSTPMPSWSNSSPILVGDRLLVSSEPDTLICLRAADGQILWQRPNPVEDAVKRPIQPPPFLKASAESRELKTSLQKEERELTELRRRLGSAPGDERLLGEARARKVASDGLRERLASLAPFLRPQVDEESGYTSPTPTSDGQSVFVSFSTGVAASYDLDGRRRWIRFLDQPEDRRDVSASPVLVGDSLVLLINDLIAVDKATGEILWRADIPHRHGTPIAFSVDGQHFLITPSGHCVRAADGAIVASGLGDLEYASPLIRDRVLYMIGGDARAFEIPARVTEPLALRPMWAGRAKGSRFYSSPLLLDGLIYAVSRNQILSVLDAATGAEVQVRRLDLGELGGVNSVYSSPAQGGRHVFVSGLGGTTIVLTPGREYLPVASNLLEKLRSSPVFDGNRMYVRGHQRFYCIAPQAHAAAAAPPAP